MPGTQSERLVTVDDVARFLGVSRRWVFTACRSRGLPSFKVGGARRFRLSEIETWLNGRREGGEVA